MFSSIKNMFEQGKDKTVSIALKKAANLKIEGFGEVLDLDIDSNKKSIQCTLMLDGELEALDLNIAKYEVYEKEGIYFLGIQDITTSRAWINKIIAHHLKRHDFEIPQEYASIVQMIL